MVCRICFKCFGLFATGAAGGASKPTDYTTDMYHMGQRQPMDVYSGYQTSGSIKYGVQPPITSPQTMAGMGMRRSPAQNSASGWTHQGAFAGADVSCALLYLFLCVLLLLTACGTLDPCCLLFCGFSNRKENLLRIIRKWHSLNRRGELEDVITVRKLNDLTDRRRRRLSDKILDILPPIIC